MINDLSRQMDHYFHAYHAVGINRGNLKPTHKSLVNPKLGFIILLPSSFPFLSRGILSHYYSQINLSPYYPLKCSLFPNPLTFTL